MPSRSITVTHLTHDYKSVRALDDISLEIPKGELFGFIGPDGAGKTTLFRILTTLLVPTKGKATVEGLDTVKDFREIRKITGYMPGRFSLYMDLSVEENLQFYATIFGTTVEKNYDLVKDIYRQIEPFKKRRAGNLSGGMKQKLALSCAMIHEPVVLFLDEPTTGVDAISRKEFWEMLRRLKEKGITILVSTPYMDEAGLCDRVALMQGGKIMKISSPQQIMQEYPHRMLSVTAADTYKLLLDLEAFPGAHSVHAFGQAVHVGVKDPAVTTEILENYLREKGNKETGVVPIPAGIEDCFMELMTTPPPASPSPSGEGAGG
jgi:ABC-2 type transport system ATP-binding protein